VTAEPEAPEVAKQAPPAKPKLTLVVVLSMLLGILLTLILAGGLVYYQRSKALHAELLAALEAGPASGTTLAMKLKRRKSEVLLALRELHVDEQVRRLAATGPRAGWVLTDHSAQPTPPEVLRQPIPTEVRN